MSKLFLDSFIELIRTGKFTDEELKEILNMYLSQEIDLEKIFKTFYK